MGNLATTRLVYGGEADLIENENDSAMTGSVNYNYNNATGEDNFEVEEAETETETETATTTRTVSLPRMEAKKKFDIVPLITGGSLAYLAHVKFASNPYSWAYVLGSFTVGYVGGAYLSKAVNK